MSKVKFEKEYCNKSGITIEFYHETQVTLPCHCGVESCQGWTAVSNNPVSIKAHNDLYG
jgi:hypothetical protein